MSKIEPGMQRGSPTEGHGTAVPHETAPSTSFQEAGELGLHMGALFLQSGASTARVVNVTRDVLSGLGLPRAEVVVTPELMMVVAGEDALPHPLVRVTPQIRWNIHRVVRLEQFVAKVQREPSDYRQLRQELEGIQALPSPHSRWTLILVWACVGAFLSRLMNADWSGTAVAALACAVGEFVRSGIGGRLQLGLTTLITGAVAAIVGALGLRLHVSQTPLPTLTASVALLIPGLWLITGGLDVISGRQIRFGLMRLVVAFLFLATIAAAIALALEIVP